MESHKGFEHYLSILWRLLRHLLEPQISSTSGLVQLSDTWVAPKDSVIQSFSPPLTFKNQEPPPITPAQLVVKLWQIHAFHEPKRLAIKGILPRPRKHVRSRDPKEQAASKFGKDEKDAVRELGQLKGLRRVDRYFLGWLAVEMKPEWRPWRDSFSDCFIPCC